MALAWQSSLFAGEDPSPDSSFLSCRRTELAGGAWLEHQTGWLTGSDALFSDLIDGAPWAQRSRPMYDRVVEEPRLTSWWRAEDGDAGLPGAVVEARRLLSLRSPSASRRWGATCSATATTAWRGTATTSGRCCPRPGDLLVMGGTCQRTWEHCIPKVRRAGPRMSVTFRHGEEHDDHADQPRVMD